MLEVLSDWAVLVLSTGIDADMRHVVS